MREQVLKLIEDTKVVAIIRGLDSSTVLKVAAALYEGGVRLVEVTFNQNNPESFPETVKAIKGLKENFGSTMSVGAGTVMTTEQLMLAYNAGAEFIVSPDTNEQIISETVRLGMVSLPGAYTPTEAQKAHLAGADFVKLFPCTDNAFSYIKAIKSPLSHIKFLAVGGVNSDNARKYLDSGAVGVGMGSSLTNKAWIDEERFDLISDEARKTIESLNG